MKVDVWPSLLQGSVEAPGSKSDAQRMVACALLARGTSIIHHFPVNDDCEAALQVAQDLGAIVSRKGASIEIKGGFPQAFIAGIRNAKEVVDCGESGLASRMFASIAALSDSPITITGKGSLMKRPFNDLLDTLKQCGVEVTSNEGQLPIVVQGPLKGGAIQLDATISSQFLTGLLIALSRASEPSIVDVVHLNSKPYIQLTMQVLEQFGVVVKSDDFKRFHISPKVLKATELAVPGDWSGAAFLLVAGALCAENGLLIDNLSMDSAQADRAVLDALNAAGVRMERLDSAVRVWQSEIHAFEFDATDCPDLFPPLTSLAAFANGVSIIKGVSRLVHKESNRAKVLQQEFAKAGIRIVLQGDEMKIYPSAIRSAQLNAHGDHRIAMAAAMLGIAGDHISISGAESVSKSFPGFFALLQSAGARISGAR
jgi:3-phosphoshikimate 1-carboxyvinyltransferase